MVNLESKLEALGLFSRTSPSPTGEAMSKRSYLHPGEKEGEPEEREKLKREGERRGGSCVEEPYVTEAPEGTITHPFIPLREENK